MEKENNTELSCEELIEIGSIPYDYEGSYNRRESGIGMLVIRRIFGLHTILLKTKDGNNYIVIAGKREKWGNTYNAYFKVRYSECYLNLPDNMIDLISSKKQ